jgi:hypothetical protein
VPLPANYNGLKFDNLLAYNSLLQGLTTPVTFLAPAPQGLLAGGTGGLPAISSVAPASVFSLVQTLLACVTNLVGLGTGGVPLVGGLTAGLTPISCVITLVGTLSNGATVTQQITYLAPTLTQLLGGASPFKQQTFPDLTGLTQLAVKEVKPLPSGGGGLGGLLGGVSGADLLMRLPAFA